MFLFAAFLIFTGALFAAAYYLFAIPQQAQQQVLAGRLRELRARTGTRSKGAPDLLRREQRGSLAYLGDFVGWVGVLRRLQTYIHQANLKYRAAEVVALCILLAGGSYLLFGLFGMKFGILRVFIALAAGAAPILYIRRARTKRMRKFEENLPDAIDLFNRSMKAGHNIHSGLETIAQETVDPVRMEFKKVIEELALGSPIEDALRNLGERIPLVDLKFFVTGLILQRQTGANMVQVLENLALLVRERLNLSAKMKAATAQQRFSAGLLCVMPIVVGLGFWILKPEYMKLLYTDETGSKFLTYAIVSEIVGILVIRKIANPKF
ncbi:MAG: type II secretion system F family protein [Bryobacteraceae bacterium]